MKKTIAILLILVIGMVGVFADEPPAPKTASTTLKLNTVVEEILQTKLVPSTIQGITKSTFEGLEGTDILTAKTVGRNGDDSVGVLYVMTNNYGGYTLSISGIALASAESSATITTKINYILTAGDAILDTHAGSDDYTNTTASVTVPSPITNLTITPYAVAVTLDTDDFDAAQAADDYTTTVTFTFTAAT